MPGSRDQQKEERGGRGARCPMLSFFLSSPRGREGRSALNHPINPLLVFISAPCPFPVHALRAQRPRSIRLVLRALADLLLSFASPLSLPAAAPAPPKGKTSTQKKGRSSPYNGALLHTPSLAQPRSERPSSRSLILPLPPPPPTPLTLPVACSPCRYAPQTT